MWSFRNTSKEASREGEHLGSAVMRAGARLRLGWEVEKGGHRVLRGMGVHKSQ